MRAGWLLLASSLGAAAAACATPFPHPGAAEVGVLRARDPEARLENLEHGRALYLGKCGGCHLVIEPARFPADAWPAKVERMNQERRVTLAPDELEDITRYLVAASRMLRG
jgi:mono/diheme cytochrome c family protein